MAVLLAQFWCKILKFDIAFSRYGNFIDDVMTDQGKIIWEKARNIWESVQSIGVWAIQNLFCTRKKKKNQTQTNKWKKHMFLHQILQVT